jgi:hypothetical protein
MNLTKPVGAVLLLVGILCIGAGYKLQIPAWAEVGNTAKWEGQWKFVQWSEVENTWVTSYYVVTVNAKVIGVENDSATVMFEVMGPEHYVDYQTWDYRGTTGGFGEWLYLPVQLLDENLTVENIENVLAIEFDVESPKVVREQLRLSDIGVVEVLTVSTHAEENLTETLENGDTVVLGTYIHDIVQSFDIKSGVCVKLVESERLASDNTEWLAEQGTKEATLTVTLKSTSIPLATVPERAVGPIMMWTGVILLVVGAFVVARPTLMGE